MTKEDAYKLVDEAFSAALAQALGVAASSLASEHEDVVRERLLSATRHYVWGRNQIVKVIQSGEIVFE